MFYRYIDWFLFGMIDRVFPHENFFRVRTADGGIGRGKGAWEIAGRYAFSDLNDANMQGGTLHDFTLGLNWYLNAFTRVKWELIEANLDRGSAGHAARDRGDLEPARQHLLSRCAQVRVQHARRRRVGDRRHESTAVPRRRPHGDRCRGGRAGRSLRACLIRSHRVDTLHVIPGSAERPRADTESVSFVERPSGRSRHRRHPARLRLPLRSPDLHDVAGRDLAVEALGRDVVDRAERALDLVAAHGV